MFRRIFIVACMAGSAAPAHAQLDPLLVLKDSAPFVLFVAGTSDPARIALAGAAMSQTIRMNQDDVQFGLVASRGGAAAVVVRAEEEDSNDRIQQLIAGASVAAAPDTTIADLLSVAKAEADRLMANDGHCTRAIVILITGGGATVSTVVSAVPIDVVAITPDVAATDMAGLAKIAASSGGQFVEVTQIQVDAAQASPNLYPSPLAGAVLVPELVAAFNTAPQQGLAGEMQIGSPVIGTVNLDHAKSIGGASLPNTVVRDASGGVIPQRSNVMLTTALVLPGARASLKAFRQYVPIAEASQRSGYRFVADGAPLWTAKTPADPAARNLFTATPDGTMIPFSTTDVPAGNLAILAALMNLSVPDAQVVIAAVRAAPLGAIIDSTPAIMGPPSLDPPPDDDYPAFAAANSSRRSLIWAGTNAGVLECIDARLGVEVWGFIPMNLLPKLKRLRLGQGLTQFQYFVDGAAKIADVKIDGTWRTHLIIGEGAGGTCYQSFDVTLAGMFADAHIAPDEDGVGSLLAWFADAGRIRFNWAFPRYSSFDPTATVWDGNLDAFVQTGDVKSSASAVEKSVGQTWSDPAVGQVVNGSGPFTVLVGSGFLPFTTQQQANRGGQIAGTTFYAISAKDGTVYDSRDVGSDGQHETLDDCGDRAHLNAGEKTHQARKKKLFACNTIKNALPAGPAAVGSPGSRFVTRAYTGDLDGRVWRFDIGLDATTHLPKLSAAARLYDAGQDQPIFGSIATVNAGTAQYIFFGTGSDQLPSVDATTTYRLVGLLDNGTATATRTFNQTLAKANGKQADEKVSASPAVAGDVVFFTTTTIRPADACVAQDANLYALTVSGGAAYDSNGDNKVDQSDSVIVKTITGDRATAPVVADQHLILATASKVALFGDPSAFNRGVGQAGVRVLSWREVR